MSDYEFKISAFSPDTIPMARLAEYMGALADLLGEKERVHFERLKAGSTVLAARVEEVARPKVRQHLVEVRSADESDARHKVVARLNSMLRDDNAEGALRSGSAEIVRFPGRHLAIPEEIGPITKHTEVRGVLVRIGGKDRTAHAHVLDPEGRDWGCVLDRDLARRLAPHLFGVPVILSGEGRWKRTREGKWELISFKARSFEAVEEKTLSESIDSVRRVPIELRYH